MTYKGGQLIKSSFGFCKKKYIGDKPEFIEIDVLDSCRIYVIDVLRNVDIE